MAMTLQETARGDRRRRPGHPRRRREHRHDRPSASTAIGHRVHRGEPPGLPRHAVHHAGVEEYISGVILYDETIRQSGRRHAVPEAARGRRDHPRHQGRHGRQGPRRPPGEKVTEGLDGLRERLAGVRGPRRALRQVARGDHHRRRHPDRRLHPHQRPRAGPLRRPVPGGRASCRSSSPRCSWTATTRIETLLRGDRRGRCTAVFRELAPAARRRSRAWCSSRTWSSPARGSPDAGRAPRRSRSATIALLPSSTSRPPCRASSSSRAASPTSRRATNLDAINQLGAAALAADVLLRPRAAGAGARGVGRRERQRRRRPGAARAQGALQQRRRGGALLGRAGGARPVDVARSHAALRRSRHESQRKSSQKSHRCERPRYIRSGRAQRPCRPSRLSPHEALVVSDRVAGEPHSPGAPTVSRRSGIRSRGSPTRKSPKSGRFAAAAAPAWSSSVAGRVLWTALAVAG